MTSELTRILAEAEQRERLSADELLEVLYDELRAVAQVRLQNLPPGQTLQATALVHEAYLRLVRNEDPGWDSRGHFFAAAARAMRDILVEQARRRKALKRGGDRRRVPSEHAEPAIEPPPEEILAVNEAIERLEHADPRKGRIVNLRYFARMTTAETAAALGISVGTVGREWRFIRAWLESQLAPEKPS